MDRVVISALEGREDDVEIVERKGLGHPDTICDALAEALSQNLCREYRRRFGHILHHNVDKALLSGGAAAPALGGGTVLAPIDIYLAGRAVSDVGGEALPITDIAVEGSRAWLAANLHALDAVRDVRLHPVIHQGSQDLRSLFSRGDADEIPLANDTSIGVGHAPLSVLERLVLAVERTMNDRDRRSERPAWGEDAKIMGIRCGNEMRLTVACAMIGRHLPHVDDYLHEKASLAALVRAQAAREGVRSPEVTVNAADDIAAGRMFLTVTGTSAEAGDDGQVGRGNRVTGLITPCRAMTLEAAAGKNPVTHTGKIYGVLAQNIAQTLARDMPEVARAQCLMVSQIGAPVTRPAVLQLKLASRDGIPLEELRDRAAEIAADRLRAIPRMVDDFVAGRISVF